MTFEISIDTHSSLYKEKQTIQDLLLEANYIIKSSLKNHDWSAFLEEKYVYDIQFTDEENIKAINKQFRNKDSVTDVLSFSYLPNTELLVGHIIFCEQRCKEQAIHMNHSLLQEILVLYFHSMLHLFGYDHIEEEDYIIMQEKESELLKQAKENKKIQSIVLSKEDNISRLPQAN